MVAHKKSRVDRIVWSLPIIRRRDPTECFLYVWNWRFLNVWNWRLPKINPLSVAMWIGGLNAHFFLFLFKTHPPFLTQIVYCKQHHHMRIKLLEENQAYDDGYYHVIFPEWKGRVTFLIYPCLGVFSANIESQNKSFSRLVKLGQIIRSVIHQYDVMNSDTRESSVACWNDRIGACGNYWYMLYLMNGHRCNPFEFTGSWLWTWFWIISMNRYYLLFLASFTGTFTKSLFLHLVDMIKPWNICDREIHFLHPLLRNRCHIKRKMCAKHVYTIRNNVNHGNVWISMETVVLITAANGWHFSCLILCLCLLFIKYSDTIVRRKTTSRALLKLKEYISWYIIINVTLLTKSHNP